MVLPTQARRDHEDVVGYSRLMAANEAATVETLKSYRDIITRLVVRHSGRVANSPGDALLADGARKAGLPDCVLPTS